MNNLLQQASNYLKSQEYTNAINCTKTILNSHPNQPSALYMQAVAYNEIGNYSESLRCLKILIKLHPNNSEVYYNLGLLYEKMNNSKGAIDAYKTAIKLNSKNPFVYNNFANQLYEIGEFNESILLYKQAILFSPSNIGLIKNLAKSYFANKNFNQCIKELIKSSRFVSLDINDLSILIQSYIQIGNYRDAYNLSETSINDHASNYIFYHLLGLSALKMCRYPIAIKSLKKSIKLNSKHTISYMNLAISYSYLAKYKEANIILDKLISLTNNDLETIHFVCKLKEMQNELSLETPYYQNAIKLYPNDHKLLLLKSLLLFNSKKYNDAISQVNCIIDSIDDQNILAEAHFLLGNAYDKNKSFPKAWKYFSLANREEAVSNFKDPFNSNIINSIKQLETIKIPQQNTKNIEHDLNVIFVIGFPRSGTTLIDSILSRNSSTIVLEEVPLIEDVANHILNLTQFDNYYETLRNLTESQLHELRELYINNIQLYHEWDNQQIIIDKSPVNIFHSLLIHLLFPNAPIIFAVRHPLDVSISCFMQNFRSSGELTNNFKDINLIATTYNNLLSLWQKISLTSNLNFKYVKYEELISDFENQVKSLVKFVGFKWSENFLTFYKDIKSRGMIHNPSYNQVDKPIYLDSKYKYHNYINEIKPIIETTKIWQKHFHYLN